MLVGLLKTNPKLSLARKFCLMFVSGGGGGGREGLAYLRVLGVSDSAVEKKSTSLTVSPHTTASIIAAAWRNITAGFI